MRNFDWFIFYGFISVRLIWIRIMFFNHGISLDKTPLRFSERYGYHKYLRLPYGWRISILKAKT
uniref:Uncharacterized protein n=1 Tax=viral metagenome TaxID=1070528 RepID=A0A6M3IIQ7_9ZZZZ